MKHHRLKLDYRPQSNMDDLFDSKEKQQAAVSLMKRLKQDEAWKIITSIVQENVKHLEDMILVGADEEDLQEVKWLRKARKLHLDFINTPQMLIDQFSSTTTNTPEFDPYITGEEIRDEVRKARVDKAKTQ